MAVAVSLTIHVGSCLCALAASENPPSAPLPSINAGAQEHRTNPAVTPPTYGYRVKNSYPHDRTAFTQGLVFEDGDLVEGTGLNGRSTLRRVELETGKIIQFRRLPSRFFGEGITIFGERIVQLTWQTRTGFVYDKHSFALQEKFHYPTEGWGLTHDGNRLILSDGTDVLYFLDPETFQQIGKLRVVDHQGPVTRLNELEYVKGEIFANIWQTDRIARIAPDTGRVTGWIDLAGLLNRRGHIPPVDVLNGIAYDEAGDRLFVTGKLWPTLFEIELISHDSFTP
jgi:glutamine cyclotransferase